MTIDRTNNYITFNVTLNTLIAISAKYFIPDIYDINVPQNLAYFYIGSTLCLVICYAIIQTNAYQKYNKPDLDIFKQRLLWNIVFTALLVCVLKYTALFKAPNPPTYILNLFTITYFSTLALVFFNAIIPLFLCLAFMRYFIEDKLGVKFSKNLRMSLAAIAFPIFGFFLLLRVDGIGIFYNSILFFIIGFVSCMLFVKS